MKARRTLRLTDQAEDELIDIWTFIAAPQQWRLWTVQPNAQAIGGKPEVVLSESFSGSMPMASESPNPGG